MNLNLIPPLGRPEYWHVLLNPLPIYVLGTAAIVLAGALLLRNRQAQLLGLGLIFLSAGSAWPVYQLGQKSYNSIYLKADEQGKAWLDIHMHRGRRGVYAFYALAAVALLAVVIPKKAPKTATPLAWCTFVAGLICLGMGGWIAKAGGQTRHPEFRHQAGNTNAVSFLPTDTRADYASVPLPSNPEGTRARGWPISRNAWDGFSFPSRYRFS